MFEKNEAPERRGENSNFSSFTGKRVSETRMEIDGKLMHR